MYSQEFLLEMQTEFNYAWADLEYKCPDDELSIDDDFMMYCMGGEL